MSLTEFDRILGRRSVKQKKAKKPPIQPKVPLYPRRPYALGKTRVIRQGVAGWRNNYYRPHDVQLAPATVIKCDVE